MMQQECPLLPQRTAQQTSGTGGAQPAVWCCEQDKSGLNRPCGWINSAGGCLPQGTQAGFLTLCDETDRHRTAINTGKQGSMNLDGVKSLTRPRSLAGHWSLLDKLGAFPGDPALPTCPRLLLLPTRDNRTAPQHDRCSRLSSGRRPKRPAAKARSDMPPPLPQAATNAPVTVAAPPCCPVVARADGLSSFAASSRTSTTPCAGIQKRA
jgi:hypothetical protein